MKKILILLMICVLAVSAFAGCGNAGNKDDEPTSEAAGSKAPTEAPTQPEPTDPPGPKKQSEYFDFYVADSGTQTPCSITEGQRTSVGTKFTVDFVLEEFSIECPSWSDAIGTMTFKLYEWNTDYATTVGGTALYEETVVDYEDNSTLSFVIPEGKTVEGAHTYLWILCDGADGVGTWAMSGGELADPSIQFFVDGVEDNTFMHKASLYGYKMVE